MFKYIAIALLALGVGYAGAYAAENSTDHQDRQIQKIESRY